MGKAPQKSRISFVSSSLSAGPVTTALCSWAVTGSWLDWEAACEIQNKVDVVQLNSHWDALWSSDRDCVYWGARAWHIQWSRLRTTEGHVRDICSSSFYKKKNDKNTKLTNIGTSSHFTTSNFLTYFREKNFWCKAVLFCFFFAIKL